MGAKLRVTLRKSIVGSTQEARGTVRALGLRRIGQTRELPDQPAVRGMVRAVRHLVSIEEVAPEPAARRSAGRTQGKQQQESGS